MLGWFNNCFEETGLRVVRIKNKFSAAQEEIIDGLVLELFYLFSQDLIIFFMVFRYRDLSLSVVFTGESGLRIIGEIQVK